ncbi:hypothetical protein HOG21_01780 [bacterium]|nr:hypothetical protein [bacterium]
MHSNSQSEFFISYNSKKYLRYCRFTYSGSSLSELYKTHSLNIVFATFNVSINLLE